jgi:phosphatidylglycerophosphate synthase
VFVTSTTTMRDRVDHQLAVGVAAQLALLAALAGGLALGPLGWLVGAGYAVGLWTLLAGAARRAGSTTLGPADLVTLARAVLVGGVAALVADRFDSGVTPVATLVVLAAVALALDGVDGQVARRTGTASALGARFDMEVDAFLVLVLSVHVAVLVNPWALAIGGMRYAFVAASCVLPWLRGTLPTRYSAKVVAAATGIALVVASAGVLPRPLAAVLVLTTLAAVTWSFGQSVAWLWRARGASPAPVRVPGQRTAGSGTEPTARPTARPTAEPTAEPTGRATAR